MIDREKVIKALECCDSSRFDCEHCSYGNSLSTMDECHDMLLRDACELLKEHEEREKRYRNIVDVITRVAGYNVGRMEQLRKDALTLPKEQEAVEPIMTEQIVFGTTRKCSKCNRELFPAGRYCPHCGRKVKWDA